MDVCVCVGSGLCLLGVYTVRKHLLKATHHHHNRISSIKVVSMSSFDICIGGPLY